MATNSVWYVPWQSTSRNSKSFVHTRKFVDPTSNTFKLSTPSLEQHDSTTDMRESVGFPHYFHHGWDGHHGRDGYHGRDNNHGRGQTGQTGQTGQIILTSNLDFQVTCVGQLSQFCDVFFCLPYFWKSPCREREEKRQVKMILPVIR